MNLYSLKSTIILRRFFKCLWLLFLVKMRPLISCKNQILDNLVVHSNTKAIKAKRAFTQNNWPPIIAQVDNSAARNSRLRQNYGVTQPNNLNRPTTTLPDRDRPLRSLENISGQNILISDHDSWIFHRQHQHIASNVAVFSTWLSLSPWVPSHIVRVPSSCHSVLRSERTQNFPSQIRSSVTTLNNLPNQPSLHLTGLKWRGDVRG